MDANFYDSVDIHPEALEEIQVLLENLNEEECQRLRENTKEMLDDASKWHRVHDNIVGYWLGDVADGYSLSFIAISMPGISRLEIVSLEIGSAVEVQLSMNWSVDDIVLINREIADLAAAK